MAAGIEGVGRGRAPAGSRSAATVAGSSALSAGLLVAVAGDTGLAVLCPTMAGACAGFLPHKPLQPGADLHARRRQHPIGLLVAAVAMDVSAHTSVGAGAIVIGALLLGLPLRDTTLVTISRRIGGRPLLTRPVTTSPTGCAPASAPPRGRGLPGRYPVCFRAAARWRSSRSGCTPC